MKKYLFLAVVMAALMGVNTAFSEQKIEQIYENVVKMSESHTPNSYTVEVENERFREALKELPKDVLTGKGQPAVVIKFEKGRGVKLVIENVQKEYSSLFSMYEEYFKFSGISKVQNPSELKELVNKDKVEFYQQNPDEVIIKAWDPQVEQKGSNYALFFLDRDKWVIKKAEYYLDGEPYMKAVNSYKYYNSYYMPYKIVLTNLKDSSTDEFIFSNYQFN
ncbi:MAG: hypothetical protein ACOC7U_05055 [Spirochaetota bacterium]